MATTEKSKNVAKGQQQPLIISGLIIGASMLLASINVVSDLHSPFLFILKAAIQPATALILLVFLLCAALMRSKVALLSTLTAILINAPFLAPKISIGTNTENAKSPFMVATLSTLTRTKNVDDILKFINAKSPDLLCLQELSKPHRDELITRLNNKYRYQRISDKNNHLTLSDFPLSTISDDSHLQISQLNHPKLGEIDLINVHMPRPYRSTALNGNWKDLLERLSMHPKSIICGDLNITPSNTLYDILIHQYGLSDSLKLGYGFTFPNGQRRSALFGPLIRIDYIFSKGLQTYGTTTINASRLSDHRAVITNISN